MAGLMNPPQKGDKPKKITTKNKPGNTGPLGENPARGKPKEAEEESNVSPEEQKQYDAFVSNGMNMIYEEKALPAIVESIKGDGSPVEGAATALVSIVSRLQDSAEQAGEEISPDVMYHGGVELLEHLVDVAEAANVHEFSEEEMESALFLALDMYRTQAQEQGKLPQKQLEADFQTMLQAENTGTLDEVLPGIEEYAERAPKPEQMRR